MAAPLYKPPTRVTTRSETYLNLVVGADPDWPRSKLWQVEYETTQRWLMANPYQRGAYNRLGNAYPVGAQYGKPDPLVLVALAPTVGNPIPGLYSQSANIQPYTAEDGSTLYTTEDGSSFYVAEH